MGDSDTFGFEPSPDLGGDFNPQTGEESMTITAPSLSDAIPFSEGYDPASIYENLQTGTWIQWGFETQVGTPMDGTSAQLRNLSPFIIRVVPPAAFLSDSSDGNYDPNLLNLANSQSMLSADRTTLTTGGSQLLEQGLDSTDALEQIISAGRLISSAGGTEEVSVITDIYTYADIALQVQGMVKTPPLRLLVNPQELTITHTSIQEYQNRSREGYIFQRWGTAQPKLSIKGSTGSFITGAPPGTVGRSVASEGEIWERFQRSTKSHAQRVFNGPHAEIPQLGKTLWPYTTSTATVELSMTRCGKAAPIMPWGP